MSRTSARGHSVTPWPGPGSAISRWAGNSAACQRGASSTTRLQFYGRPAVTPAFGRGLDRVLAEAQTRRIALLCSEEDPSRATATCSSAASCGRGACRCPTSGTTGASRARPRWPRSSSAVPRRTPSSAKVRSSHRGDPRGPYRKEGRQPVPGNTGPADIASNLAHESLRVGVRGSEAILPESHVTR